MGLNEEINNLKEKMMGQMEQQDVEALTAGMKQLLEMGITESSLKVGDKIPKFSLPNGEGVQVKSEDLLKQGKLVISFFRGGWCPFCDLELRALENALPEVQKLEASIIAISPQILEKTKETSESHGLTFEVVSDEGNRVAREFGLVFSLPEEIRPVYKKIGIDLSLYNGDYKYELPVPATYVVATDGTIEYAFVDADYTKRLDPVDIVHHLKKHK